MKTLLERHFDTAFDAPDGIKRLRELILTLAMQGKLVKQDPKDPPASELLKEIEAEKKRLVKAGKIKQPKPLPPIKPEEVPYELPQGWAWVRLGDVVLSILGGGTPSKNNSSFWGGNIPWASVKDLNVDVYLEYTIDSITEQAVKKSSTNIVPKGSIIVCTRMGLGKIAINKIETAINQDLKALTISSHIDQMFFFKKYKNYKITGSGMTVHGIKQDELLGFLFPLPPLAEQHRIVAKIDQLMARCDALEKLRAERDQKRITVHAAAIRQLLDPASLPSRPQHVQHFLFSHFPELYAVKENVIELRKAILNLAVQGKLVPQDPNDLPASELLKEIEAEKKRLIKAGKIKQSKPLPSIKPDEIPYGLPKGWEWVRLGDFGITQTGTTPRSNDPENFGDHIPFIGPGNIKNGKIDYTGLGLSEKGLVKGRLISANSILMVCIGGSIGKHAITDRDITCNQQLNTLTPYQPIPVRFVYWGMATNLFLATILRQAGGSATPIINKQKWSSIILPLPPLAEQHRIVAKIDQLMALCDAMENQITSATHKQTTLLEALLKGV